MMKDQDFSLLLLLFLNKKSSYKVDTLKCRIKRLLSQHQSQRHTAILRLEESRLSLLKRQQATDVLKFHNPKSKDSFSECAYCPLPKNALPENPENTPEQNTLKSINMRMHGKRRWLFSLSFRFLWNRTMFQRLIVVAGSMLALLQLQRAAVSEHVARIGDGKCRRNDCFSMNYEGVAEIGIPSRSCRSSLDVFHRRG
ncbi:hypothetical protein AMTRI_Chr01g130230 [Amborella trichopoda]